jgi:hypothetical protein
MPMVPQIPFSHPTQRAAVAPTGFRQTQRVTSPDQTRPASRSRLLSQQQRSEPPSLSSPSTSSSPIKSNNFRRAEYRDPTPPRGYKPPS